MDFAQASEKMIQHQFTVLGVITEWSTEPFGLKGGVYLEACYGISAPIFRFFVQMFWKIVIVEGLDASLRYQSFKTQLQYFVGHF